jgi:hypothetical protein
MEAQLQVMSLESNNSTLQAQLSGMRQQKQQLEQMLLFGSGEGGCFFGILGCFVGRRLGAEGTNNTPCYSVDLLSRVGCHV